MDDIRHMFTESFWDERYSGADRVWSGRPNQRLVEQVGGVEPGAGATALDVGCGEGADAVWLATRGWTVTGADVSGVALRRAAEQADRAGVADRTSWLRVDVLAGDPLPDGFDLVTAAFVHVPPEDLAPVYGRVAGAVAPGGTLLVTAHHPADGALRNPALAHLMLTPEDVVATLAPGRWTVEVAEAQTRVQDVEGTPTTVTDTVVRAVRRL
jgi:SAM-dependent methyltransferase